MSLRRPGRFHELVVLARGPAPGRCKRRLAADLGPEAAAAVQERLSRHTLAAVALAALPAGTRRVLAIQGTGLRAARRWAHGRWPQGGELRIVAQGGGSLGLLMQRQLIRARREGAGRVVLIGSDLPRLESGDLAAAFQALEQVPLVLGPAGDGGYWLIGLNGSWPRLFSGIAWGTGQVLEQTLAAAAAIDLQYALLPRRDDLDRLGDLHPWR
jgi:rSAM/selenodomain-associated transferase 1